MSSAQQYLALVFSEASVVAALWQKVGTRIQIIARSNLAVVEEEKWVEAIDASLEELGPESLAVKKALFAVPATWTVNGELVATRRAFLKELTTDLLLEPLGFVLVEDTLLAWQEEQLGQSFTGTIITSLATTWELQRVESGSVTKTLSVGKSGEGAADWEELQAQLSTLAQEHRRGLYLELAPTADEYGQIVVKLRQLLQAPVEKIKPDQLAEIAILQGGHEILAASETHTSALPAVEPPVPEEDPADFQTPDFVISTPTIASEFQEDEVDLDNQESEEIEEKPLAQKKSLLAKLGLTGFSLKKIQLPKNRKVALVGGILAALLLVTGIAYAILFTRYTVAIAVELEGQNLERSETMALSGTASQSAELFRMLAPEEIQETITVDKEVPTTGTKVTGEPAKGKVLLYNKTEDIKTFPAGTTLTLNGKTFKLDSDVQVASASSREGNSSRTIEFGSLETTATASFIGPEGNIAKDERFTVANFSSSTYEAVSQEEFTGGSSREIQSVAAADITAASNDLLQQAKAQLEESFLAQNTDEQMIFFAGETNIPTTDTSKKIDEEAKLVRVQLTVQGKAYKIDQEKLVQVTEELFADQIPNGYIVQQSSIVLRTERILPGNPPRAEVRIQARAVPDIQPAALQQIVAGQYTARAKTLLEESPGVKSAQVKIKPEWAASLLPSVPNSAERVKFNLQLR